MMAIISQIISAGIVEFTEKAFILMVQILYLENWSAVLLNMTKGVVLQATQKQKQRAALVQPGFY